MKKYIILSILIIILMSCQTAPLVENPLMGTWIHVNKIAVTGRILTETLVFYNDMTYTIQARFNDTYEIYAETYGHYEVTRNDLTLIDYLENTVVESYRVNRNNNVLTLFHRGGRYSTKIWKRKN